MTRLRALGLGGMLLLPLGGCSSLADILGAGAGTAATVGSSNPAVGIAVGVATRAAADWAIRTVGRRWTRTEQEALAEAIGATEVGEERPWHVRHTLPFGDGQGEVRVLRVIDTPLARCKEAAFSVAEEEEADAPRRWFLTTACRQEEGWAWAGAEPATGRWGSLQ